MADQGRAQAWLDGLQTQDRSAKTVQDIWLSAIRTVYRWGTAPALDRERPVRGLRRPRLIESSPFEGCVVEVPRKVVTRETDRTFTEAEARAVLLAAQLVPLLPIGAKGREWARAITVYRGRRGRLPTMRRCETGVRRNLL